MNVSTAVSSIGSYTANVEYEADKLKNIVNQVKINLVKEGKMSQSQSYETNRNIVRLDKLIRLIELQRNEIKQIFV